MHQSSQSAFRGFAVLLNEPGIAASSGYRLRGNGRGPHLVVVGAAPLIDAVFDRLMAVPSLSDIHGSISLRRLDDDQSEIPDWFEIIYDDVLVLDADDPDVEIAATMSCLQILRRCTQLGMFQEREG